MEGDSRMLQRGLDEIDRMDAAFDAAECQVIGEPERAGAQAGADFEYGSRAQFRDQRRIHSEIENVLHQRRAAPAHQRGCALARQQHIDAELGAEPRMIMATRLLAPANSPRNVLAASDRETGAAAADPMAGSGLARASARRCHARCPPRSGSDRSYQAGETRVNQLSKMLCRPFCSCSIFARISPVYCSAAAFSASPEIRSAAFIIGIPYWHSLPAG